MNDLRFALRQLLKHRAVTAVAAITLALGIGANTAIFSVVNAVLLRPLPYPNPAQLVQVRSDWSGSPGTEIGSAAYLAIRERSQSLARLAAYTGGDLTLTGPGVAERWFAGAVSAEFFPLLGIQPALGRNFTPEEDSPQGPKAVILDFGLWQNRFGGDSNLLGQTLTLNGASHTVVGILPATFRYPEPFRLWTPLALGDSGGTFVKHGEGMMLLKAIARLKPGIRISQAQAELQTIARSLQSTGPSRAPSGENGDAGEPSPARDDGGGDGGAQGRLTLVSLHDQVVGDVKRALLILLGAVTLVLLIACANVANLQLARANARQRELAVRTALGAGRWHIVRERLTECVLLSALGGGLGLCLAFWGVRILGPWTAGSLPALQGIGIDARVLAFTFALSLVTGLVFGLAPALQAWRTDVHAALKDDGRSATGGHRNRLRHLLVVSEVALALILLIGAGLLLKSFSRLTDVPPGFRTEDVLTFEMTLTDATPPARKVQVIQRVLERLQALPAVQKVAATDSLPLTPFERITLADIEGRPPIDVDRLRRGELSVRPASRPTVTHDYFSAMGIRVKSGRGFEPRDAQPAAGTVIVNETFEKHHFPGESAVGKRLRPLGSPAESWLTVVGVVGDVRQSGLAGEVMPEVYSPELDDAGTALSFVLRTSMDPAQLASVVRAAVAEVEPTLALHHLMTMEQRLADTTRSRRLNTFLLGGFAGVALILAAVGIYGVMSFAVTQRRREIGVRLALGARKDAVLRLVIGGGMRLALVGVACGWIGAFALTRTLAHQLYAVTPTDPLIYLGVALALAGVALLACLFPAIRAARVDPLIALRTGG